VAKKKDYDLHFENKKGAFEKQLKEELKPRIDEAVDREFVARKILEEMDSRKQNLTHDTIGDVEQPDFYKQALIEGFDFCLKTFRDNPVEHFMTEKLPEFKKEHLDKIKEGYVHGYQLDATFIQKVAHKEILELIAKSHAYDEISSWLRQVAEGSEEKSPTAIETEISGTADHQSQAKPDQPKTFSSIFKDPEMTTPLLDFLKENNITDASGKWIGLSKGKTDLMGFMDALKIKSLINFTNDTEIGKIFKNEFNVSISERSMTSETFVRTDARTEYLSLIDDFLLEYRQEKSEL